MTWTQLSLVKAADRGVSCNLSLLLKDAIKSETAGMSAEEIRAYSIKKTAKQLSFTIKNDIAKGEANCVGYVQFKNEHTNRVVEHYK